MNKNHPRVIGTTESAVTRAEAELTFELPPSFRKWLLENNGKGIEDVTIFPVDDERDPRKTWDSIVRNFNGSWKKWIENYEDSANLQHLLPFGEFGTGDYFCFDYSSLAEDGEARVVVWLHETGRTKLIASNFAGFVEMAEERDLDC